MRSSSSTRRGALCTGVALALVGAGAASTATAQTQPQTEVGRVILVTGSTGGLGREVALRLGEAGANVIVHGRDAERGRQVVEQIQAGGKGTARFYAADFSSLAEVRRLADEIRRDYDRLDVLVNNAGILLAQGDRQLSEDGYELHWQVNYLAGYLLTHELLPLLERAAPSRIVNVASGAQRAIDFENVNLEQGYSGSRAYAQSKLAQILFTVDLSEQLADRQIRVLSLHPATYMDTDMVREAGVTPRSTVDEGADAVMHLIDSPDVRSGQCYNGMRPARPDDQANDPEARRRLRALSEEMVRRE